MITLAWLFVALFPCIQCTNLVAADRAEPVAITLRPNAFCSNNIVRLSDVAELKGDAKLVGSLAELVLGPAPIEGKSHTWSLREIKKQIGYMGLQSSSFQWSGAEECSVMRGESLDRGVTKFHAIGSSASKAQCERNMESVIHAYLRVIDPTSTQWKVTPIISLEQCPLLQHRNLIKEIGGGTEPWEGTQEFEVIVQTGKGQKQKLKIPATIKMPDLVVAASKPIRQGQILRDGDLEMVRLPVQSKIKAEDCAMEYSDLVGKELRRAMSSGQPITKADVGAPRVVDTGDLVQVELVNGSITIETNGKCLSPGGTNDLVQIEVLLETDGKNKQTKKKLLAQVIDRGRVRVAGSNR